MSDLTLPQLFGSDKPPRKLSSERGFTEPAVVRPINLLPRNKACDKDSQGDFRVHGVQEIVGPMGPRGWQGEPGQPGIDGKPGPRGDPGERGPRGKRGDQGDPGKGLTGERGPPGPIGDRGPRGEMGETGPQGTQGIPGVGIQGLTGKQGERGERGPQGESGPKGDIGQRGEKGETGSAFIDGIGPPGPRGERGEQGPMGEIGPPGERGPAGDSTGMYPNATWGGLVNFSQITSLSAARQAEFDAAIIQYCRLWLITPGSSKYNHKDLQQALNKLLQSFGITLTLSPGAPGGYRGAESTVTLGSIVGSFVNYHYLKLAPGNPSSGQNSGGYHDDSNLGPLQGTEYGTYLCWRAIQDIMVFRGIQNTI